MSKRIVFGAAALIWIVIKLPQEYWIHIAQMDTTDWIKTGLFGVPVDTAWSEIFWTWPLVFAAALVGVVVVLLAVWWLVQQRLRPAERALAFCADRYQPVVTAEQVRSAVAREAQYIVDGALIEKAILISLISLCFAQVLPGIQSSNAQLAAGVALIVVLNTVLSHWLARRGFGRAFTLGQFTVLVMFNTSVILSYAALRTRFDAPVIVANALFFVILLSLLVTLFDHYRQVTLMGLGSGDRISQCE